MSEGPILQQAAAPQIVPMEEVLRLRNVIWQPQYDTTEINNTILKTTFFTSKIGEQLPFSNATKTDLHTNMVASGQLPKGQIFYILGIRFWFALQTMATPVIVQKVLSQMMEQAILKFTSQSKEFLKLPLENFTQGHGIYSPGGVNSFENVATNGVPDPRAVFTLKNWAIKLSELQDFTIELEWENPLAQIPAETYKRIKLQLDGPLFRPVN